MCYHLSILKKGGIDINIITAEEAREKTDSYISPSLKNTIEYVMKEIENSCNCGNSSICFYNCSFPNTYFENMKSTKFIEFMKKLGYKYNHIKDRQYYYEHTEKITISW